MKKILIFIILFIPSLAFGESAIGPLAPVFHFQAPLLADGVTSPTAVSSFGYWIMPNGDIRNPGGSGIGKNVGSITNNTILPSSQQPILTAYHSLVVFKEPRKFIHMNVVRPTNNQNSCDFRVGLYDPLSLNDFTYNASVSDPNLCYNSQFIWGSQFVPGTSPEWFRNSGELVWRDDRTGSWYTYETYCDQPELGCPDGYTGSVISYIGKFPFSENVQKLGINGSPIGDMKTYYAFGNASFYIDKVNKTLNGFSYTEDPNIENLLYDTSSYPLPINNNIDAYSFVYYPGTAGDSGFYVSTYSSFVNEIEVSLCNTNADTGVFNCSLVDTDKMILYYNIYEGAGWTTNKYLDNFDIKIIRDEFFLLGQDNTDGTLQRFYIKNDGILYTDQVNPVDEPPLIGPGAVDNGDLGAFTGTTADTLSWIDFLKNPITSISNLFSIGTDSYNEAKEGKTTIENNTKDFINNFDDFGSGTIDDKIKWNTGTTISSDLQGIVNSFDKMDTGQEDFLSALYNVLYYFVILLLLTGLISFLIFKYSN